MTEMGPSSSMTTDFVMILLRCRASAHHIALNPPSRFRTQLFAYLFWKRNIAASATSSTSPNRLKGIVFEICSFAFWSGAPAAGMYIRFMSTIEGVGRTGNKLHDSMTVIGVLMYPGTIALTRTCGPLSAARALVKPVSNQHFGLRV
jgi:hypothetical protein